MLKFPDKQIIATGDKKQLDCISCKFNSVSHQAEYIKKYVDYLFPNQINLTENKRLDNEEDKIKLNGIQQDLFNEEIDVMTTLTKYGLKLIDNLKYLTEHEILVTLKIKLLK